MTAAGAGCSLAGLIKEQFTQKIKTLMFHMHMSSVELRKNVLKIEAAALHMVKVDGVGAVELSFSSLLYIKINVIVL